jgi:hypothetical protein
MWVVIGLVGLGVGVTAGVLMYARKWAEVGIMAVIGFPLTAWLATNPDTIGLSDNDAFAFVICFFGGMFIGAVATGH